MSECKHRTQKLMLIDAYALVNRAFYALPSLSTSDGQPTGALYGLISMLFRLLDEERPDYVAVAFDRPGPTVRHTEFAAYKGTRAAMPDDLRAQIPFLRPLLEAMNLVVFEHEGYEADDVLGSLARHGELAGRHVTIVTGDKDLLQLVSDGTEVLLTRRGISEVDRYHAPDVLSRLGVRPDQVTDYKGLTGDTSDNIPGVPGIGPKTAERLLNEYGSLEAILSQRDAIKGKPGQLLRDHAEQAQLSKRLATIYRDLPLEPDWNTLRFSSPVSPALLDLLRRFEFARLIEEVSKRFSSDLEQIHDDPPKNASTVASRVLTAATFDDWLVSWEPFRGDALLLAVPSDGAWGATGSALFIARRTHAATHVDVSLLPMQDLAPVLTKLLPIWRLPNITWIAHDSKNVALCLAAAGLTVPEFTDDLMLASYVLSPGQGDQSTADVVLKSLHETVPSIDLEVKGRQIEWDTLAEQGAVVCEALLRAYDVLQTRIAEEQVQSVYKEIDLALVPTLIHMEQTGIAIDGQFLGVMSVQMEVELQTLTARIYQLAGVEFNINSPKQLANVLFDRLGLPVKRKTKTGPSTNAEVLEELAEEHEIVSVLLDYRQAAKLKSTYIDALPALVDPRTGRLHTTFNQAITATGRLSSTHPNLQNIPVRTDAGRQIRRAFVPGHSDYVLLAADYSQIELRVLAHLSGDEGLVNAFLANVDIHTKTASEIFAVAPEEVTPEMRSAAKAVNFGIVYGISSFGLARGTHFTRAEAQGYIDAYFDRYPGVKTYMKESVAKATALGYAETISGRKRWIPNLQSRNWPQRSNAQRTAMNTPIQGSAADIMKIAMIRTFRLLQGKRASMLLQVHDELLLEVHRDDLLSVAQLVKRGLEEAVSMSVPLIAQVMAGPNWLEMDEVAVHA